MPGPPTTSTGPGRPAAAASGAVLFARYAYPPNELGYCGPEDADALLRHTHVSRHGDPTGSRGSPGAPGDTEIARRAQDFDGAWPYLRVIAAAAGLPDPLHPDVVEAYWVGNALLDAVDRQTLLATLQRRFRGQTGGSWRRWAGEPDPHHGPGDVAPHHSFQVFEVYPWVGLLGRGNEVALRVLDRCRIRWGTVLDVDPDGEHARVRSAPLGWDGRRLLLAEPRTERVRWSAGGRALAPPVVPGDRVALHWDWVCDVLDADQLAGLVHYSRAQLELTNQWLCGR